MGEVVSLLNGIKASIKRHALGWLIILAISITIVISICGLIMLINRYRTAVKMQIEDKNGSNKALCVITDEMIEAYDHTYYAIGLKRYCEGTNSSHVSGENGIESFDNSYTSIKAKKLSGVYLCNVYLGSGKKVTFSIKSTVKKGNLKIVITDSKGKIIQAIPIDQTTEIQFSSVSNELYFLKCAAESVEFEMVIARTETE